MWPPLHTHTHTHKHTHTHTHTHTRACTHRYSYTSTHTHTHTHTCTHTDTLTSTRMHACAYARTCTCGRRGKSRNTPPGRFKCLTSLLGVDRQVTLTSLQGVQAGYPLLFQVSDFSAWGPTGGFPSMGGGWTPSEGSWGNRLRCNSPGRPV
jgi:hypothetical protein